MGGRRGTTMRRTLAFGFEIARRRAARIPGVPRTAFVACALLALVLFAACSPLAERDVGWVIRFACSGQGMRAQRVELSISQGECQSSSGVVYGATIVRGGSDSADAPPRLGPGYVPAPVHLVTARTSCDFPVRANRHRHHRSSALRVRPRAEPARASADQRARASASVLQRATPASGPRRRRTGWRSSRRHWRRRECS